MKPSITLFEVGPRDGLQNEPVFVPTKTKVEFINQLSETGLRHIEVTSFVSAKSIPQLADNQAVFHAIHQHKSIQYSALIPNEQGMIAAIEAGVQHIAIFTAASEQFNQRNIQCSIQESIERFKPVMKMAKMKGISVRGYISCALGCPYEGTILPKQVIPVIEKLFTLGVDSISLGDTIGVGTPKQTKELLTAVKLITRSSHIAMHFHDTYGQAIANICASLECGITQFDSSVAGLGGCPYARGATGNVATEDVLYLMHGLGLETGIDIYKMVQTGNMICKAIGRKNQSKAANALLGNG